MAFVRWRGCCAQLLATVYENGRSRQITLSNLTGLFVSDFTKMDVAQRYPEISVDWEAVDRALAKGPHSHVLKQDIPQKHLDYAEVEHNLREWAKEAETNGLKTDAAMLKVAADILVNWRAKFYWDNGNRTAF